MFRLRLFDFLAFNLLGYTVTYEGKFYDGTSTRGRILWATNSVREAIDFFKQGHKLHREKNDGSFQLEIRIEATDKAHRPDTDITGARTARGRQLPLTIPERVQDSTETVATDPDPTQAHPASPTRAGGGRETVGHHAGNEAPARSDESVEVVKPDLSSLGLR